MVNSFPPIRLPVPHTVRERSETRRSKTTAKNVTNVTAYADKRGPAIVGAHSEITTVLWQSLAQILILWVA